MSPLAVFVTRTAVSRTLRSTRAALESHGGVEAGLDPAQGPSWRLPGIASAMHCSVFLSM